MASKLAKLTGQLLLIVANLAQMTVHPSVKQLLANEPAGNRGLYWMSRMDKRIVTVAKTAYKLSDI